MIHAAGLGLTDDEAYYWVLAQRPDWAYAYHPPAVAWVITAAEAVWKTLTGNPANELIVRLPGVLGASLMLGLALQWMREAGGEASRTLRSGLVLLSFAGLFALAWMMVPDLPLFVGWTLAFLVTWRICYGEDTSRAGTLAGLALAVALSLLSKYSGVLVAGSAGLCVLFWSPRARRWPALAVIIVGALIGVTPSLIWNARHEWASLLYQIHGRHEGGSLSLVRYFRFWLVELLVAGPVLIVFSFRILRKSVARRFRNEDSARVYRFAAVWMLPPALIYCTQPLWADFKPHWAFVIWWPAAMVLGWEASRGPTRRIQKWITGQIVFGLMLGAFIVLSCHVPLVGWLARNPKLDVTNDLYGWSELRSFVVEKGLNLPVVGSRYQTASQAAFALRGLVPATLLPRDLKARDEWPELGVSEGYGPEWPRLRSPVLFVADNRYDAAPAFPGAKCEKLGRIEKRRGEFVAKWIDVWRCEP